MSEVKVTNTCRFKTGCRRFRANQCTMYHAASDAEAVRPSIPSRDLGSFEAYYHKTMAGITANCTCDKRRCQRIHQRDITPDLDLVTILAVEIANLEQRQERLLEQLKTELVTQFAASVSDCTSYSSLSTKVRIAECPVHKEIEAVNLEQSRKRRQRSELVTHLELLASELQAMEPQHLDCQRDLLLEHERELERMAELEVVGRMEVRAAMEQLEEQRLQLAVSPVIYQGKCQVCFENKRLFGCSDSTGACDSCLLMYFKDAPVAPLNGATMPGMRCLMHGKLHRHRFHLHRVSEFLNSDTSYAGVAAIRGQVEQLVADKHREFIAGCVQRQIALERERIMRELQEQSEIDRTVDQITNMITTKCPNPRCGVAFVLVDGCRAINCDACRAVFCHICLEYHASDSYLVHEHVADCIRKHRIGGGRDYYASDHGVRQFHIDRFTQRIRDMTNAMPEHKQVEVLKRVVAANSDYAHLLQSAQS